MKKTLSLIMALALCFSLCACGHSHTFGEWNTVSEASCTAAGSKERVCECGEKETEVIAATGHSFGEATEISPATCTEDGQSENTCTVCGIKETVTISATGHTFKAATAFAAKTCSGCGLTEGEPLAKLITVGDVIESEDHSFTVESTTFTGSLSDKRGYITYAHSSDFALAIKLSFTNLSTEAFERWSSDRVTDVTLEYKGKYKYEGEYWNPVDDIVPLASDTIYIVYEVPNSMCKDSTSSIFASFTIDDETYAIVIQEGDGVEEEPQDSPEAVDVSGNITKGDVVTNEASFSFELDDLYYTSKPSYKSGNVTHSYGSGSYYFVCKLDFTNLAAEVMEDWNSDRITDISLSFADKYTYEGDIWMPLDEIVPLDNGYVFILFEVPETVETSTDALIATFTVDGSTFTVNCR